MCMVCSTELTRRLPPRSSRCRSGSPSPSPEETATGAAPHQRAKRASVVNRVGSPTSTSSSIAPTAAMPTSSVRVPRQHRGDALVELTDALVQPTDVGGGGGQPGQVDPVGPGELELVGGTLGERPQPRPD